MKTGNKILGHLCAFFVTIVWGTTFISTKILLQNFSAVEIIIYRLLIGLILLFIICPKIYKFTSWKRELMYMAAAITGVSYYQILENLALTCSYASTTGIIISAAPLFTTIFSFIFLREEKPAWNFFVGFIMAMGGIFMVSFDGGLGFNLLGIVYAVSAIIIWGLYSVITKKTSDGTNIILMTRRIFEYGLISLIPMYFIFDCHPGFERFCNPVSSFNIIYLGAIASAICFAVWNFAQKKIGVIRTNLYLYLLPVITVLFSIVILHEKISWTTIAGAILTIGGMLFSMWRRHM